MSWLVDTNVISELARPAPDAGVVAWARTIDDVSISVVTVEEIACGLAWKPNARVEAWLDGFFREGARVLPIDETVARRAGQLRGLLRRRGRTRSQGDMLIAATAAVHALTLVTRNVRDFAGCGIPLLDPFVGRG